MGHGEQQPATMRVTDSRFPGVPHSADFSLTEEWYSLKNFQKDIHVILAQETKGMQGKMYARGKYPETWARMHGKGRVFYTSLGTQKDFENAEFRQMLGNAVMWAGGR